MDLASFSIIASGSADLFETLLCTDIFGTEFFVILLVDVAFLHYMLVLKINAPCMV